MKRALALFIATLISATSVISPLSYEDSPLYQDTNSKQQHLEHVRNHQAVSLVADDLEDSKEDSLKKEGRFTNTLATLLGFFFKPAFVSFSLSSDQSFRLTHPFLDQHSGVPPPFAL